MGDKQCSQGDGIMSDLLDFMNRVSKEMQKDRLQHQSNINGAINKMDVMNERVKNLINRTEGEIKVGKESRLAIHNRINNLWKTLVGFSLSIAAGIIALFIRNHSGH